MTGPYRGPEPGDRLVDRYRLVERVGAGGMGEVWRAADDVLGRTVAVKLMRPELFTEPGFHERFLVEARAMAGVSHPGVVAIHDYRVDVGGAFLVMEFVEGESLAHLLARHGRLRSSDALEIVARAADAVQAVHDRGIVHRDIKPANLLVRPDGTVMLADFGIARTPTGGTLTGTGGMLGTPSYLAPEQVMGQPATARSDVYALGVVAYECLAGYRPFEADNPFAVAMMRLHEAPRTMVADVPPDVWAVVARALAVDPAHRWATAADMAAGARAAQAGRPVPLGPAGTRPVGPMPVPPGSRWRARRRLRLAAAAIVVAAAVGVGAWLIAGPKAAPGNAGPTVTTGSHPPDGNPSGADPTGADPTGLAIPAGYVACDKYLCPTGPACWGGMVVVSGVAGKPRVIDCAENHYWQTFQATWLPPGAAGVAQEELMNRSDIASICSAANLAKRSRDPAKTRSWTRDALPYTLDGGRTLLICLAGPGTGEWTGSLS